MNDFADKTVSGGNWTFKPVTAASVSSKNKPFYMASKRLFDLIVSALAIPLFLTLCVVIWMLNFFWNPGPLFYRQTRMGKHHCPFQMIKFRTMLPEDITVKRGPFDELEEWRITPFGRWMRRSRIDEVPQFLNIVFGQMSLIGPRPEVLEFAEAYGEVIPGYRVRESVRPGITGYAQVTQGYTASEEAMRTKTKLDTYYVHNMGWWLDIVVIVQTVRVLLTSNGAR